MDAWFACTDTCSDLADSYGDEDAYQEKLEPENNSVQNRDISAEVRYNCDDCYDYEDWDKYNECWNECYYEDEVKPTDDFGDCELVADQDGFMQYICLEVDEPVIEPVVVIDPAEEPVVRPVDTESPDATADKPKEPKDLMPDARKADAE